MDAAKERVIERWQIWHMYATYCLFPIRSVVEAGRRFVDSGLAVAALASSGEAWWVSDGATKTSRLDDAHARIDVPAGTSVPAYAAECLKTAIRMEAARRRVLAGNPSRPSAYVRAFLEPMMLTLPSGSAQFLYPQILLDSSGVIVTEFRTISPAGGTALAEFIEDRVNLFRSECTEAAVPLGPLRWFVRGISGSMRGRGAARFEREADEGVAALGAQFGTVPEGVDFPLPLVRLFGEHARRLRRPQDPPLGLRFLGHVVEIATGAAVLCSPEVLGKKNARRLADEVTVAGSWSGRPAVYLLASGGEAQSVSARMRTMKDDLAKIMWRTSNAEGLMEGALGRNLRLFDDYAVFVNSALYLWVCERVDDMPNDADPNDDSIVCEKQVQVEFAEALWARHLRIRALAEEPKSSLAEIARLEQELWRLTQYARVSSRYSEIWSLLKYAGEQFGVEELRAHVQEGLRLRGTMLEEKRSRREQWFGVLLSVLLGIGASETLSDRFLLPFVKRLGYDLTEKIFWLDVGSLGGLVTVAVTLWWLMVRRRLRV